MLHINMQKPLALGGVPRSDNSYLLEIGLPTNATIHGYISENPQRWSGGVVWTRDVSDEYVMTFPATADEAIPVLSYHTRSLWDDAGTLSEFSPQGPRIDGLAKNGIAAPGGYDIVSSYAEQSSWLSWYNGPSDDFPFTPRFGSYRLISGTSAAGGFVAGCAALMLQVMPERGRILDEVMGATARSDAYTGAVPNAEWGHGKLDVLAAVNMMSALLEDDTPPTVGVPQANPAAPDGTQAILINVTAEDDVLLDRVILSYTNSTGIYNVTMSWTGSCYEGEISPQQPGETVSYQIYAIDQVGNTAGTALYQISIQSPLFIVIAITISFVAVVIVISAVLIRKKRMS